MTTATDTALFRFAQRVSREPFFLSHHLAVLRQEYGQTIEEQAAALGLDIEGWSRLALCRMPATVAEVERIARAFGLEAEKLQELLQLDL